MKTKISLIIFFIGAILIVSGVLMIGSQNEKAKAATNYTINWEATKFLNAAWCGSFSCASDISLYTDVCSSQVAGWNVSGNVGGSTFNEVWSVPENAWLGSGTGYHNGDRWSGFKVGDKVFPCINATKLYSSKLMGQGAVDLSYAGSGFETVVTRVSAFPTKWTVTGTID